MIVTEARASLKLIRISPMKLVRIARTLNVGMSAKKAIVILQFCKYKGAKEISQMIASAMANAENNHGMDIDKLSIKSIVVGSSLKLRRHRPMARGRAFKILKRSSNAVVVLHETD